RRCAPDDARRRLARAAGSTRRRARAPARRDHVRVLQRRRRAARGAQHHHRSARVIARSLRAAPPPQRVERVLARVRGYKIKLPPGTELGRLELSKEEHAFATRLKQGGLSIPFDAPEADPPPEIARLLYLLVLTRQLQIEGKSPMRTSPP